METVLALIAVVAAAIAFGQVYLMRSTAHGELLYDVVRRQAEQNSRDDRSRLYSLAAKPFEDWTADEYQCAERVSTVLDQVGFMVKYRYVTMRASLTWHNQVVLCDQIAEPLIEYRRKAEGVPALFLHFEWLARKSHRERDRKRYWWHRTAWRRLRRQTAAMSNAFDLGVVSSTRPDARAGS